MKRFLIAGLFLFWFQLQPVPGQTPLPDHFDEWIEESMAQWEIPGMAKSGPTGGVYAFHSKP